MMSIASIKEGIDLRGLYVVGYGLLFGMSIWVTFISGAIAFKSLPREQLEKLQHRTLPWHFNICIALSGGLLFLWNVGHPHVWENITNSTIVDVAQAYALVTVLTSQLMNRVVFGPMTSKTMSQRHRLEKEEKKAYNEPGVSVEMKALNVKFARLYGISSLLNLFANFALIFHGFWIGTKGFGGL